MCSDELMIFISLFVVVYMKWKDSMREQGSPEHTENTEHMQTRNTLYLNINIIYTPLLPNKRN